MATTGMQLGLEKTLLVEPIETRALTSDRVCTSSSAPSDPYGQGRTHTGKSENDSQISCYSISLYVLPLWLFFFSL